MSERGFWNTLSQHWEQSGENQNGPTLYPLASYRLIGVQGPDAEKFLQGQLTCDLKQVTPDSSTLGACCTPKGRMLAMFRIARLGTDRFLLSCPGETADIFFRHLAKYKVFFKCELHILEDWGILGCCGDEDIVRHFFQHTPARPGESVTREQLATIRVPGEQPRFEIWLSAEQAASWLESVATNCRIGTEAEWELQQVRAGLGEVYQATQGEFIPQMLNLQSLGGISFKKGCYTGQEIVARMQYLGKLKKRMYLISIDSKSGFEGVGPGAALTDQEGRNAGTLVRTARNTADQQLGLAVIDNAAAEAGNPLSVESLPTAQCHIHPLPYPVEVGGGTRPTR